MRAVGGHKSSKMREHQLILRIFLLALLVSPFGCARMKADHPPHNAASPSATPSTSPVPLQITAADLGKLRWIEGTWRGTGGGVPPFYERYKFENDSTLVVEGLADETFTKVNETSRFELKDGHFGHSEGESGSLATALDDNSISFEPFGKPSNSFRFQRESNDSWKAILKWTDKTGAPKERVYNMERWQAKEQ
jgi:hypothetical protein